MRNKTPSLKTCYCRTCDRAFHYLGIMRHRAMHREKRENCEITYTHGNSTRHLYGEKTEENHE